MGKFTLMAYSSAKPGVEDRYDQWLDSTHLPDVLKIPGVASAQRYKLKVHKGTIPYDGLTIYELDTEDLDSVLNEIQRRRNTPELPISEDLDHDKVALVWGERAGPAIQSA